LDQYPQDRHPENGDDGHAPPMSTHQKGIPVRQKTFRAGREAAHQRAGDVCTKNSKSDQEPGIPGHDSSTNWLDDTNELSNESTGWLRKKSLS
jgi:hypothetical protein